MVRAANAQSLSCCKCSPPPEARLSACHGREKRDFASTFNRGIGPHMPLINSGTNYIRIFESVGVFLATRGKPRHQLTDRGDASRNLDHFLSFADTFAHPGEITHFQAHSSII